MWKFQWTVFNILHQSAYINYYYSIWQYPIWSHGIRDWILGRLS